MPGRHEDRVCGMPSGGPVAPNEVAVRLGVAHKEALRALMRLAPTRGDVRYKPSGRIHLFWRERT